VIAAGLPERSAYTGQMIDGEGIAAPEIGALAPNFTAPTLTGSVELNALRGQPVVVNFWATWCAPCEIEMPELQAFQSAHPSARVLAVNLGEPPALITDWLSERGITLDIPRAAKSRIFTTCADSRRRSSSRPTGEFATSSMARQPNRRLKACLRCR
jgi:thiol-disulfide isomerase/thioredoxin